jgi:[acyl-carrier-protein] S-malonyltransferase
VPVVANIDARVHTDAEEWRRLLSAQLSSPVRWRQSVRKLLDEGATTLVELGPGGVLTGMAKRIDRTAQAVSVATPEDLDHLLEVLQGEPPVPPGHDGEHLYVFERMVVSPAVGIFQTADRWKTMPDNSIVEVGELLGTIGDVEVRSLFAGELQGMLAMDGERVVCSQPIAWLRTA